MASLNEILALEHTQASIKKIDLFMSKEIKNSLEYIKALCFKATVLVELEKINDALKLLYSYVNEFKTMDNECVVLVCDAIITICIDVKRYDQVSTFIALKKNYLPISKSSEFLKDQIKLYLAMEDVARARETLLKYLDDDITKEEELEAKRSLSKIYFANREYDSYLKLLEILEGYYKDNMMIDEIILCEYNKILIDYDREQYVKVIASCNSFLKDNSNDIRYSLKASALLIKSYLKCNDIKKASIIEAEYRDYATESYLEEAIEFSYAALDFYNRYNSVSAIKEYHEKLRALEEARKPIVKASKKEKTTNIKKEDIVIPLIKINEQEEIPKERGSLNPLPPKIELVQEIKKKTGKLELKLSDEFGKYHKIFDAINNHGENIKFRELFRLFGIELCKVYQIEEIYFLLYNHKFTGLHYKKERAYDKKLTEDDIVSTLNYASYANGSEAFLDRNDRTYQKSIINGENLEEDIIGYSMPIRDDKGVCGSIAFFSHSYFLEEANAYEILKLITSVLNTRLILDLRQERLEFNNKMNFFVVDNMELGIKEEMDGYIHFNSQAEEILGLSDMNSDDYLFLLDTKYRTNYKALHDDIINSLIPSTIEYEIKLNSGNKFIRESFYPLVYNDNVVIFSSVMDLTDQRKEKESLAELAYTNPISKVSTEVKLITDLKQIKDTEHMALAVFDVNDFKLYEDLYGINFTNQLIYAIGKTVKLVISNDFTLELYHLDRDRFVILFKTISDKRVVTSKLIDIFDRSSKELEHLNKRLRISFDAGCYRKGKTDSINDEYDFISYSLDALNDAKAMTDKGHHIAFYDSALSRERFKTNNLVTTISEGLDKALLAITYQQIVDISTLNLFAYMSRLTLDSYEIDYKNMLDVIKRKNLVREMDRYLINRTLIELKMIKDELKGLFVIFIPVCNESVDDSLLVFLKKQINFYKINPKYIVLLFDKIAPKYKEALKKLGFMIATRNVFDLYSGNCDFLLYNYHTAPESVFDMGKIAIAHKCILILDGVNTKDDIEFAKHNETKIVFGDFYKRSKRVREIISSSKK